MLRFIKSNTLKDIRKLLKRLYYGSKSTRVPSIEGTSFYVRVDNSLLILLSNITKQFSASVSGVDGFSKKLLGLFLVLDKTIIPL